MAESRYNRLDNQSPTQTQLQNEDLHIPSSAFDFSTIHSGNAIIGALIPVDCFDVVPTERISISMSNLIEFRNPTTRQLLNGFRVYFHAYYNRLTDLWEGAKNFLDTGFSSSISLQRPCLFYKGTYTVYQGDTPIDLKFNALTPMSLLNYLGLPATCFQTDTDSSSINYPLWTYRPAAEFINQNYYKQSKVVEFGYDDGLFPADCAFAYQRNWRDFYANRNLLMNNKYWFPDNEAHFILSYVCPFAVCINYGNEGLSSDEEVYRNIVGADAFLDTEGMSADERKQYFFKNTYESNNPSTVPPTGGFTTTYAPNLSGLKFRQFRGDRFTTALPFPDLIRGDIPVINLYGDRVNVEVASSPSTYTSVELSRNFDADITLSGTQYDDSYIYLHEDDRGVIMSTDDYVPNSPLTVKVPLAQITQNALRALETFTVFKERNARIKNSDTFYNGFIEAQFGQNPHTHNPRGVYLGGFYQDFALSSVTQLSQSTESSPLGQKAGQGVSNGNGTICNDFYCNDFGWIQIYMSIVPDVYYTQGKPRMFSKMTQLDMYFPLFNNLEPQAILNKELFVFGDESVDNDVFAYEDRYAEYKSRPNRVSGLMALSHSLAHYDASRVMARRFTTTPALNSNFVTMIPENIDMNVFTVTDEPPFDFSCGISVRRVAPMPYTAVPGSLSSNIHA